MAKKLLAVLLAVMMVVPMAVSPAFAEEPAQKTYTTSVYCDADAGSPYAALKGQNYPMKPYTITSEFCLDYADAGTENDYGRIIWCIDGYAFGYDVFNQQIFLSKSNWSISSSTEFVATAPYVMEEGGYYRVTFRVSPDHLTAFVNGEEVLSADCAGMWNPDRYVIFWPAKVGMYIVENSVTYADGTVVAAGSGSAAFDGWEYQDAYSAGNIAEQGGYAVQWDGVAPVYSEPVDYAAMAADTIAAIDAIGEVSYNEWKSTDFTDVAVFDNGGTGLDWVKEGFKGPASVDISFAIAENKEGDKNSVVGGTFGDETAYLGYNIDTHKFFVGTGMDSPFGAHDPADPNTVVAYSDAEYNLEDGKVYKMSLVFGAENVSILLNGNQVVSSDRFTYNDANTEQSGGSKLFGFYSNNVKLNVTDFDIVHIASGVNMIPDKSWTISDTHVTNGELKQTDATLTAEAYYDSYAAIAAAEAAYNKLPAEAQACVTNYQTLVDAKAAYVALAPSEKSEAVIAAENAIAAIGTVTRDSGAAIAAAQTAYNKLSAYEMTLVENAAALTEAVAYYNALLPKLAAAEKAISDIGEVKCNEPNPQYPYDKTGYLGVWGNGYSNMEVNGTSELFSDYTVQFDFQYVSNSAGARFAGGGQNFNAGYNFDLKTWCIGSGNPFGTPTPADGSTSTVMELDPTHIYTYKLEVRGNRITLYIDGERVAETKDIVKVPGNYFIFYPSACSMKITNYTFWSFASSYDEAPLEANLTGEALRNSTTWKARGDDYFKELCTFDVPEKLDSLAAIEAAEAAMAGLTEAEQAQVANADVLAAARAEYDRLSSVATFTADKVAVNADNIADYRVEDGSFVVPVSIKASDILEGGIAAATFGVSVEGATIAGIEPGAAVNAEKFVVGPDGNNFVTVDNNAITDENAEIAVVKVAVPHDVAAGTEIAVTLTATEDPDDYLTADLKNYTPTIVAGGVSFAVNGHVATLEHVEAKEPTRTEDGNIEYWHCTTCDKYYADAEATQEITLEDTVIPKLIVLGDVDSDGSVNAKDITALMRYLAGWRDVEIDTEAADYNEDGKLNNRDVLMIILDIVNGVIA